MKCIHFMRLKEKFSNFVMNIMLLTKMCQEAINFRSLINYLPIDIIFQHILLILNISYIFSIFTSVFSLFYFLLTHPSYSSFEIAFCVVSSYPANSSLCCLAGYGIGTWDQQIRDYTIKENMFPFFLQLSNVNSF